MTRNEAIEVIEKNRPTSGYTMLCEALDMAIAVLRQQEEQENQKLLTLDELQTMAGEPVWCSEYQCYGIIEIETVGCWANIPFLVGVWHDRGVVEKFEHNIIKRRLTLFRSKQKPPKGERNETNSI